MASLRALALPPVALAVACSSTYLPRGGPGIAVIQREGELAYVKDGQVTPHGFLGSGLLDVVRDHPEALAHARVYRSRLTWGFVTAMIGAGLESGGLVYGAIAEDVDLDGSVTAALILSGLAVTFTGLVVMASGQHRHWDAINVYNDARSGAAAVGDGAAAPFVPSLPGSARLSP